MNKIAASHENFQIYKQIKTTSDRKFCFFLSFLCFGIGYLQRSTLTLVLAIIFCAAAFIKPQLAHPLNVIWSKISRLLGKITTPIVMLLFYCTVFVGIGLLLRVLRKDLLALRFLPSIETYWVEKEDRDTEVTDFRYPF